MYFRSLLVAAIAAVSFSAQSALVTLDSPHWPPEGSTGLETVEFRVNGELDEMFVALGAHAYKNGPLLPNDDFSEYRGAPGIYVPDGLGRANWSFDFSYNAGSCTACEVILGINSDWTTGSFIGSINLLSLPSPLVSYGSADKDSLNLMMGFFAAGGLVFDPNQDSYTEFTLSILNSGTPVVSTTIQVEVQGNGTTPPNQIPEPGTLALAGVALLGWGIARRRAGKV